MTTHEYPVRICEACIRLEGQMCDTPECVFCFRAMDEVGRILADTMIRPFVDGKRFPVTYSESLRRKP